MGQRSRKCSKIVPLVPEIYFYSLDLWWGVECVCTIIFSIEYILHVMVSPCTNICRSESGRACDSLLLPPAQNDLERARASMNAV
eukprot:3098953-Amphidinium_carterae.1